jgi:hypothetical protein
MIQNTFVIGGEAKFASKFIERLNKRLGGDLQLNTISHKSWDQCGDRREDIPSGTDLVLVLKSNCNHSLRNWARKKALENQSVKFIECCHKVAIAEFDIRHCYHLSNFSSVEEAQEELDLYETWRDVLGENYFVLPLWGEDDEGLFTGKDAYERMPWNREGKKKMILKWDKIWVSYSKQLSSESRIAFNLASQVGSKEVFRPLYFINNGKSPYYKLIETLKSFRPESVGSTQVKLWADQWVKDAYLGSNFKDFTGKKNIEYALQTIFGVGVSELSIETQDVVNEHYKEKRKVKRKVKDTLPEILTQEAWDDYVASNPILPVEETQEVETPPMIEEVIVPPVVNDEPYILLGSLKITPNDNVICIGEVQLDGGVHIHGGISLEVDRIENNTLYGVKIKKG